MKWQKDECLEMGAALAYYALLSLFPICLVVLSILGFLLGPETDIYAQLLAVAKNILPAEPYKMVKDTLLNLNQSSVGAGLVGFLLLFLTASKIFEALNRSVDKIWGIDSHATIEKKT
jgi:membrane protein